MTENTHYKTLLNAWLNLKQAMITASTHANFVLMAENAITVSCTVQRIYDKRKGILLRSS